MLDNLPTSVRYVKNGRGGRWWPAAKSQSQVHLGWNDVPDALLLDPDWIAIEALIRSWYDGKPGAMQDLKALRTVLDHPSQHIWITFEDGYMWWCTVRDGVETNLDGETGDRGHFWLNCLRPWSDRSLGGRHLTKASLPGITTATAGYQGTICEPGGWKEILRILHDSEDADAVVARQARAAYEISISKLVARLGDKDFELLVDLILSRTGWARLERLGGATEGIDIEVENVSAGEIAFVQIKSKASQKVLDEYVSRFMDRRERYNRMIFAVHSPTGTLRPPSGLPVQVWPGQKISELVVRVGLGDWVTNRV
jgi:hypothetical protein